MLNKVIPFKGAMNFLRAEGNSSKGTFQSEAPPLKIHFCCLEGSFNFVLKYKELGQLCHNRPSWRNFAFARGHAHGTRLYVHGGYWYAKFQPSHLRIVTKSLLLSFGGRHTLLEAFMGSLPKKLLHSWSMGYGKFNTYGTKAYFLSSYGTKLALSLGYIHTKSNCITRWSTLYRQLGSIYS